MGMKALGHQLYGETVGEGGLPRGGGAGDHDKFFLWLLSDLLRNLADALLHQRLLHQDHILDSPLGDGVV